MYNKLPINIDDLLNQRTIESERVEYKAGWNPEAVSRRYRNRRLGEFLKELELTEGRSTGIPKILQSMASNGSQPPEFDTDEDRSYFSVRLVARHSPPEHRVLIEDTTEDTTEDTVQRAFLASVKGQMSRLELQQAMSLKNKEYFRKHYIIPALEYGYIAMTLPDKPTSKKQKYYLTAKGQELLETQPTPLQESTAKP